MDQFRDCVGVEIVAFSNVGSNAKRIYRNADRNSE